MSVVSAINDKKQGSTRNILKEKPIGNDVNIQTPEETLVTHNAEIFQASQTGVRIFPTSPSPIAAPPPSQTSVLLTPLPSPPLTTSQNTNAPLSSSPLSGVHTSSKGEVENNRESLLKAICEKHKLRTKEEQVIFDEKMKARRQQKENCKTKHKAQALQNQAI